MQSGAPFQSMLNPRASRQLLEIGSSFQSSLNLRSPSNLYAIWMKVILAVMCTTWAVVKIRPEKNSGLYGIWTHDLCAAPVSQRSWVQIPYRPEFFSGLIFTTAQVVLITARITFIQVFIRSSNTWLSYILSCMQSVCNLHAICMQSGAPFRAYWTPDHPTNCYC